MSGAHTCDDICSAVRSFSELRSEPEALGMKRTHVVVIRVAGAKAEAEVVNGDCVGQRQQCQTRRG